MEDDEIIRWADRALSNVEFICVKRLLILIPCLVLVIKSTVYSLIHCHLLMWTLGDRLVELGRAQLVHWWPLEANSMALTFLGVMHNYSTQICQSINPLGNRKSTNSFSKTVSKMITITIINNQNQKCTAWECCNQCLCTLNVPTAWLFYPHHNHSRWSDQAGWIHAKWSPESQPVGAS